MPTDSALKTPLPAASFSLGIRWFCMLLAVVTVGLQFYPGIKPIAPGLFPESLDKLVHLIVFGTIAALIWVATDGRMPLLVVSLVAGIGAFDEWHKIYLPGHSVEFMNFLTDVLAGALAVSALHIRQIWKYRAIRW